MKLHGIRARGKRRYVVTTDSKHKLPIAADQVLERLAGVFEGSWYKDELPVVYAARLNALANSGATELGTVLAAIDCKSNHY